MRTIRVVAVVALAALLPGCAFFKPIEPLAPRSRDPFPVQAGKTLVYVPAAVVTAALVPVAAAGAMLFMAGQQAGTAEATNRELTGRDAPLQRGGQVW